MNERPRILLVEDERIVALELGQRLRQLGFDILGPADTGGAAVDLALSGKPDLVLMDVRLKGNMDGPEAATLIRQRLDVPVVFLTAYADEATLTRVTATEPYGYVVKPFDERSLLTTIRMALHRHQVERERNRAVQAQRDTEAMSHAVLDSTHDAIVCIDGEQRIAVFNKGAEALFGWSAAEVIGRPLDMLLPAASRANHHTWVLGFAAGTDQARAMGPRREVSGLKRNGEAFLAEVTLSKVELRGRQMLIACVRDISQRRLLEQQLLHAQKMEAVGRLSASVAHDFNNLLAAIGASAHLLKGDVAPDGLGFVEEISQAVDRGVALTRKLLGFSRAETAAHETFVLSELVSSAEFLLKRLLPSTIDIRISHEGHPAYVHVVRGLIDLVLMNLALNARDAMPKGGILSVRTSTTSVAGGVGPGRYGVLEVSDTGSGIDEALSDKVFEPFFTTKPPGLGTGLGLSTIREIVRNAGGEVRVRESSARGTTFVVLLPLVDAIATSPAKRQLEPASVRGTETILLVDDDAAVLRSLERVLSMNGYRTISASGVPAGLVAWLAPDSTVDLLLSGIVMGAHSGVELARRIRHERNVPVLFMTGYAASDVTSELAEFGVDRLLTKPIAPAALLSAVRAALDGTRTAHPEAQALKQR